MKKKIIIIAGDPRSINSEIIFKCWKKLSNNIKKNIYLIANFKLIKEQFKLLNYKINPVIVKDIFKSDNSNKLKVINIKLNFKKPFKIEKKDSSKYVLESLHLGHNLALNKNIAGIINCPIDKRLIIRKNIGVTELLASKCKIKKDSEVMVIKNEKLIVSPLTTHIDIKNVTKKLSRNLIISKIETINKWYLKLYQKKPKIGILGLNPHNAELKTNSEEKKIIIPAINKLRKKNFFLKGPLVSDTVFIKDYKNFDIIIGMYHDQILTPFKTLYKFKAINLTLGLKYVRVSPDHGVAVDKILKKKSNPESLLECIKYINKLNK